MVKVDDYPHMNAEEPLKGFDSLVDWWKIAGCSNNNWGICVQGQFCSWWRWISFEDNIGDITANCTSGKILKLWTDWCLYFDSSYVNL